MTRAEALKFPMPFGKYKGQLLGHIYAEDESYFDWLAETVEYDKWPQLAEALAAINLSSGAGV